MPVDVADPVKLPLVSAEPVLSGVVELLPLTVQELTSVAFQLMAEVPPGDTDDTRSGFAVIETFGCITVTLVLLVAEPPGFEQVTLYGTEQVEEPLVTHCGVTRTVPFKAFAVEKPLPLQEEAFVELQCRFVC